MVSLATVKPTDAAALLLLLLLSINLSSAVERDSALQQKAGEYDTDPARVHIFSILNKLYDPLTL